MWLSVVAEVFTGPWKVTEMNFSVGQKIEKEKVVIINGETDDFMLIDEEYKSIQVF